MLVVHLYPAFVAFSDSKYYVESVVLSRIFSCVFDTVLNSFSSVYNNSRFNVWIGYARLHVFANIHFVFDICVFFSEHKLVDSILCSLNYFFSPVNGFVSRGSCYKRDSKIIVTVFVVYEVDNRFCGNVVVCVIYYGNCIGFCVFKDFHSPRYLNVFYSM